MTIELKDGGYEKIMDEIQNIEELAVEGIFPKNAADGETAFKKFQNIASEVKQLRRIIQENLLIVSKTAGPEGPNAA